LHSHFKAGRVSVENDECSGWPSTSKTTKNVEKICDLIHEDHRRTIHELSDTIGISYGICQILTENWMCAALLHHDNVPAHVPVNPRVCH
jgi:hypothetical protein